MRNLPDKLLSISALVSLGSSTGSGFIYASDEFLYFITAKHVLYDDSQNIRNSEIEITCQTTKIHDESVKRIQLDLRQLIPKYHKKTDVCAIKFAKIVKDETPIRTRYLKGAVNLLNSNSNPGIVRRHGVLKLNEILISNEIYLFGYPTSIGLKRSTQFDQNQPLIKKGIVSNVYASSDTFVMDCAVYNGNSGGPVVQVTIDENGEKIFKLIGVVSQYIPYIKKWTNDRNKEDGILEYMNSGYSVATTMDSVLELIESMEID